MVTTTGNPRSTVGHGQGDQLVDITDQAGMTDHDYAPSAASDGIDLVSLKGHHPAVNGSSQFPPAYSANRQQLL